MEKLVYEDILKQRLTPEQALLTKRIPVVGVLENIRSMYNVGSCFRTADAMLLERLILTGYTPTPPRKEISKTALSAEKTVPYEYFSDIETAVTELKKNGYKIYALEQTDSGINLSDENLSIEYPMAFIAGNEVSGISQAALNLSDRAIEIPMYGVKHSLNVAVAFGITSYLLTDKYLKKQRLK